MIFDITDQGIAPVPPNMPTCPIQGPEKADPDNLIDLKSIGAPEAEIVVTDFRSGAGVIAISLHSLMTMMMWFRSCNNYFAFILLTRKSNIWTLFTLK